MAEPDAIFKNGAYINVSGGKRHIVIYIAIQGCVSTTYCLDDFLIYCQDYTKTYASFTLSDALVTGSQQTRFAPALRTIS